MNAQRLAWLAVKRTLLWASTFGLGALEPVMPFTGRADRRHKMPANPYRAGDSHGREDHVGTDVGVGKYASSAKEFTAFVKHGVKPS